MTATATTTVSTTSIGSDIKKTLSNPIVFIIFLFVIFLTAHTVYMVKRKGKTVGGALKDDLKLLAKPTAVVAILGFVTGIAEYIITDNVNQHGFSDSIKKGKIFELPDKKKLASTAITLAVASTITGFLTDLALRMLPKENPDHAKFIG